MPCTYFETPEERAQSARDAEARRQKVLDDLTHEADMLREHILAIHEAQEDGKPLPELPAKVLKNIIANQLDHRKRDLARLAEVFTAKKDAERLAKVWAADPRRGLEAQLGFDPDEF